MMAVHVGTEQVSVPIYLYMFSNIVDDNYLDDVSEQLCPSKCPGSTDSLAVFTSISGFQPNWNHQYIILSRSECCVQMKVVI